MDRQNIDTIMEKLQANYGGLLGRESEVIAKVFGDMIREKLDTLSNYHGELIAKWLIDNYDKKLTIAKVVQAIKNTRDDAQTRQQKVPNNEYLNKVYKEREAWDKITMAQKADFIGNEIKFYDGYYRKGTNQKVLEVVMNKLIIRKQALLEGRDEEVSIDVQGVKICY